MIALRNIPLKRKLTIISMSTSAIALLLTCGAIVGFELVNSRRAMVREVRTTATMIGDNSAAALAFGDADAAALTLRSLAADEHNSAAFIYDAKGQVFARYQPLGTAPIQPPELGNVEHAITDNIYQMLSNPFAGGYMDVFHEVSAAGEPIGTIYLRHDMAEMKESFIRLGMVVVSVMVAASAVALLLSRRWLAQIAGPIEDLEQVVRDVASRKDFGIRAAKQGNDEVGRLIDGFNEMLGEIQRRDRDLKDAQDELEARVQARTGELANSLDVLNATLNSTADGILAIARSGQVICFNTKYAAMWGMPEDIQRRRDRKEMLGFTASQVSDPDSFLAGIPEVNRSWSEGDFDVIRLKDGRTFERYVQAQTTHGEGVGAVINFRDVTDRKRAEETIKEAHRQLLETSRRAGMAEVATSVLHNVGNVLNSVNVSCSVVADRVRQSRVGTVARTAALLEEHSHDLPRFLMEHPTGKTLPTFLGKLAGKLAAEQAESLRELKLLGKNLDHIKEIVAMQQGYAKVSGLREELDVAELVEDSLRMNEATLKDSGVRVTRDHIETPIQLSVERHKALQVLVNLIRNAGHACDDSGNSEKTINLGVSVQGDQVAISVTDNGVGISPENLTRIFAHGFTTKRDGHGFGLHNGALAAREMGGSLAVSSPGPGLGATFTLLLPLDVPGARAASVDAPPAAQLAAR